MPAHNRAAHSPRPSALQIIADRETGNSKGYCFVTFADERDAQDALNGGTGKVCDGAPIRINVARAQLRGLNLERGRGRGRCEGPCMPHPRPPAGFGAASGPSPVPAGAHRDNPAGVLPIATSRGAFFCSGHLCRHAFLLLTDLLPSTERVLLSTPPLGALRALGPRRHH